MGDRDEVWSHPITMLQVETNYCKFWFFLQTTQKVEATEYLNSGAEPPVPKKRKVDDASDEEEPTPALPNDEKWIYIDATGNKQGPHATMYGKICFIFS
jgi:hypothetical protein